MVRVPRFELGASWTPFSDYFRNIWKKCKRRNDWTESATISFQIISLFSYIVNCIQQFRITPMSLSNLNTLSRFAYFAYSLYGVRGYFFSRFSLLKKNKPRFLSTMTARSTNPHWLFHSLLAERKDHNGSTLSCSNLLPLQRSNLIKIPVNSLQSLVEQLL